MNLPETVEVKGMRVLTTRQLAAAYGTEIKVIQNNFQRNKDRYTVGKHYIYMDRDELREVKSTHPQIEGELRRTSRIHFWTEKGALLHAKSLNTDKAWEGYDYLVDFYFRAKEKAVDPEKKEIVPVEIREEPIKEESSIQVTGEDEISVFKALLKIAEKREIKVKTLGLNATKSYLKGNRIGIRCGMPLKEINYELAYELFHSAVNYDKGNMIDTPLRIYYNSQAERAAAFLLQILQTKTA